MIFEQFSDADGRSGISATPAHGDGVPPAPSLWLDGPYDGLSHDAVAVAGVLVYGEFVDSAFKSSGVIAERTARGIHEFLGRRFLRPISVNPTLVNTPARLPNKLRICGRPTHGSGRTLSGEAAAFNIRLQDGGMHFGHQSSRDAVRIPSNWAFVAQACGIDVTTVEVAVGTLLAERFAAGSVTVCSGTPADSSKLCKLLFSVGLSLAFEECA